MAVTLVVTVSALITPYGIAPAFVTLELLDMKFTLSRISELRSPDFQQYGLLLVYFVAIVLTIPWLGIRLRGPRLIAFGLFTAGGLSYFRGLMMFFFACTNHSCAACREKRLVSRAAIR